MRKLPLGLACAGLLSGVAPAHADYIQTLGVGERSRALGGAVVSDSSPSDAFYANPAGAGFFQRPSLGFDAVAATTTGATVDDNTGSYSIEKTLEDSEPALGIGASGYYPVGPVTIGFGSTVPYSVSGVYPDEDGIHRSSATRVQLINGELSPSIAFRFHERASIGAALNVQTLENVGLEAIPNFGGLFGLDGGVDDRLIIETDRDFGLPLAPGDYRADFDTLGFTVGAQFKPTDRFSFGIAYRSKQTPEFESTATIKANGATIATGSANFELGMPAHLQFGASFDIIPDTLRVFGDIQRTFWSDTAGFGKPTIIRTPNLVPAGASPALPNGLQGLALDYEANDTTSFRFGLEYTPPELERWSFRAGYWNDPSAFPDETVDAVTFSSDRHAFSLGVGYDRRNEQGRGFSVDVAGQAVVVESRTQDNLRTFNPAGLDPATGIISQVGTGQSIKLGGTILSGGISLNYAF